MGVIASFKSEASHIMGKTAGKEWHLNSQISHAVSKKKFKYDCGDGDSKDKYFRNKCVDNE